MGEGLREERRGRSSRPCSGARPPPSPGTEPLPSSRNQTVPPGNISWLDLHYPFWRKLSQDGGTSDLDPSLKKPENKEKIPVTILHFLYMNLWNQYWPKVVLLWSYNHPLLRCASWVPRDRANMQWFPRESVFLGDLGKIIWKDYCSIKTNMDILWSGKSGSSFTKKGEFEEILLNSYELHH